MPRKIIGEKTRKIFEERIKDYDIDTLEKYVHCFNDEFGHRHELVMNWPYGKIWVWHIHTCPRAAKMFNEVCAERVKQIHSIDTLETYSQ